MPTVDFRTRFEGDAVALDPGVFLGEHVAALPDSRRAAAGRAAARLGLEPLTLDVDGEQLTLAVDEDGRLAARPGPGGSLVVGLDRGAFSDLAQDVASTFGLGLTGRAEARQGDMDAFVGWEPAQRDPDVGDSAEGLLKKIGVVEGASDVSWHKDCALGGHSRHCCGLVVGLSVTGAGPTNGELGVVPGSHRANVAPLGVEGLDLRRLAMPTRTGDVTVHCSCTLHMSRPPVSAERRVVYTGFGLAPRPGDRPAERSPEEARRERAAQNDHVRRQQRRGEFTGRVASHDL